MDVFKRFAGYTLAVLLLALAANVAQAKGEAETRIRRDIERFIQARTPGVSPKIDVPPLSGFSVDRGRFPGKLHTELSTRAAEPLRGRVPVAVALYAGDELVKRSVVTPYVRVVEKVVVPTRDLRPGAVLARGDLVYVERDVSRLRSDIVRDLDSMVGLQVKRSLRKDKTFRASQVEPLAIVERGDRVQIVLSSGPLRISATGEAREKGGLGEWIRVLNVDSKREISGRIDQEGRVHVAF